MIKPIRLLASIALAVSLTNFGYPQNRVDKNLDGWIGEYVYVEQPLKNASGIYDIIMGWELVITKTDGHYQAVLSINGHLTFIEYLTDINGNSKSIDINFNKQTDGPVYPNITPVKGERLFTLEKINGKVVTKWGQLTPQLSARAPARCICFTPAKQ